MIAIVTMITIHNKWQQQSIPANIEKTTNFINNTTKYRILQPKYRDYG